MISIREAEDRVDSRLVAASGCDEDVASPVRVDIDAMVPLTCAGTDVVGPELAAHVREQVCFLLGRVAGGEPLASLVAGVVVQSFWLGWEHRRAEE